MVATMYCRSLFLLCLFHAVPSIVSAWSGRPNLKLTTPMDRRGTFQGIISSLTGSLVLSKVIEPETANAIPNPNDKDGENSFTTYRIIPDASASLDPRLVNVNVRTNSMILNRSSAPVAKTLTQEDNLIFWQSFVVLFLVVSLIMVVAMVIEQELCSRSGTTIRIDMVGRASQQS